MTKRIDASKVAAVIGASYPAPFDEPCKHRERKRLGEPAGLQQFGVNLLRLPPGAWSSQRHWHTAEEEFVFVVAGEVVLVTNHGEEVLRAGDSAGFPANEANGHHLQNRSAHEAVLLEVGSRRSDDAVSTPTSTCTHLLEATSTRGATARRSESQSENWFKCRRGHAT